MTKPKLEIAAELDLDKAVTQETPPSATAEELDAEEEEFRALRRDLPGVKGASAAGIVAISVGKTPNEERIFSHRIATFRPIVPIVDHRSWNGEAVFCRHARYGRGPS